MKYISSLQNIFHSCPKIITFTVSLLFIIIISYFLFSAIWAVYDAGIAFSKKKLKLKDKKNQFLVDRLEIGLIIS
ncbi:MAG: hypothetical protein ACFFAS_03270 [Promethearchaeota archaeon]